jgi:hypothetical protein
VSVTDSRRQSRVPSADATHPRAKAQHKCRKLRAEHGLGDMRNMASSWPAERTGGSKSVRVPRGEGRGEEQQTSSNGSNRAAGTELSRAGSEGRGASAHPFHASLFFHLQVYSPSRPAGPALQSSPRLRRSTGGAGALPHPISATRGTGNVIFSSVLPFPAEFGWANQESRLDYSFLS